MELISKNIYGKNGKDSISIINENIKLLKKCEDNKLEHPFCHEIAHQCLIRIGDKKKSFINDLKTRIEIFKIIWKNALELNILNDINYRDKYNLTAIQRLLGDFPRKLVEESDKFRIYSIDYESIDPNLSVWIKENISNIYKLDLKPIKKKKFSSFPIENEEIYPIQYYGSYTNNGVIIKEASDKISYYKNGKASNPIIIKSDKITTLNNDIIKSKPLENLSPSPIFSCACIIS